LEKHRLKGPLAISSEEYALDFKQVKEIGSKASRTRTADQTEIAKFWYEDSPLGWNRIANTAAQKRGLDAWEAARAFTLLNFAMADGFIAGFDAKYHFRTWRPITAIRAADTDGNSSTEADASWEPLLLTPPVPDYPSTHTVLGWAAAEVLIDIFGNQVRYETTSLTAPGVTRKYRGFAQAAQENGQSRVYAGIHFQHSVRDGRRQGRSIGRAVSELLAPTR
jgi:membrane-associated phospholipid phosphatase